VLMDDDPRKLALAIAIARKTLGIVRQNIVFSLVVKLGCLLLTAVGVRFLPVLTPPPPRKARRL